MRARDNPFATHRVLAVRYRPLGWTWADLHLGLERLKFRCAIVGPHGTGKTTLMEDLVPRLQWLGYRCRTATLRAESPRLDRATARQLTRGLGRQDIVLLDGAEQLSPLAWRFFQWRTRRAGGLIISTHAPGRLPTLVRTSTSAELLSDILNELGERAPRAVAGELIARHQGNVREALRELYDRWGAGIRTAPSPA